MTGVGETRASRRARAGAGRMALAPSAIETRRWVLDLGMSTLLLLTALAGFWTSFDGPAFVLPAVAGVVLGLAVAALCAWRGWGVLPVAGVTAAVYLVFGGPLALPATTLFGVVPTGATFVDLIQGVVVSWKRMLTTVAPLSGTDGHFLVPFLLALVAAVITGSLALRLRRAEWALIPVGVLLCMVIAIGTPQPSWPVVQGIVLALAAVVWLAVRRQWAPENVVVSESAVESAGWSRMAVRRLVSGVVVLTIAAGTGVAASAIVVPAESRHVLRDTVIPPFMVREYPSPMQSFRGYVKDHREDPLFTVSGLPEDARVRLGVMDEYNGVVYNVSDGGPGTSGAFTPLRSALSDGAEGTAASLQFSIDEYAGVWIPNAGQVTQIQFDGARAEDLRRSSFYSDATGMAATVLRLAEGDTYTVQTVFSDVPSDERLAEVEFGAVRLPKQDGVPAEISRLASDTVKDAESPIEQVRALETFLAEGGFFSHGLEGEVLSRAGHGAERLLSLLDGEQMIGDDEQYAVLMTLMARELGIPARVVLGFYPDEEHPVGTDFTATGDDVHAWVEVNFAGFGWLEFNPTPSEDQVPNDQTTKPKADPKPQVLQPPPPPQEPVDLPPTLPDERKSEDGDTNLLGYLWVILAVLGALMGIIGLLLAPFIVIGAWKATRRRRRRSAPNTADRISGGWDEMTDRAVDYGVRVGAGATRAEDATVVTASFPEPAVMALAVRADAQVFGPSEPTSEEVDQFWSEVDQIVGGFAEKASFWERQKARLSTRSLLAGSSASRGWQNLRQAAVSRHAAASMKADASRVTRKPVDAAPQKEPE